MKLQKHFSEIKRLKERIAPISVCVYPTNRCNCKCIMCGVWKQEKKYQLDYINFLQLISDLDFMKVESIVFIGGGEPTLYRFLPEIIDTIENKTNLRQGILTNGNTSFNFKKYIKHNSMKFIRFSIDAVDDKLYKKIRGVSFKKIKKNFCDVLSVAKEKTRMNSLIMNDNINYLEDMIRFAVRNDTKINFSMAVDSNEYKKKIEELDKLFYHYDNYDSYHNFYEAITKNFILKNKNKCILPLIYCVIDSKGTVYPCTIAADALGNGFDNEELKLGNIYDKPFREIWRNSQKKRFEMSEDTKKYKLCRWCSNGGIKNCSMYVDIRNEYTTLMGEYEATFL